MRTVRLRVIDWLGELGFGPKRSSSGSASTFVAATAWASRILVAATQLFVVRIFSTNLGPDLYSATALLVGLTAWFGLCELGIGSSLQNFVSECRVARRSYEDYICTAALLGALAMVVSAVLLYWASRYLGPLYLRNVGSLALSEKQTAFYVAAAGTMAITVGGIVWKIWYAEQDGHRANVAMAIVSILGLIGGWIGSRTKELEPALIGNLLPPAIATLSVLGFRLWKSVRAGGAINRKVAREIIARGLHFWIFALFAAAVLQVDYIVLSRTATPQTIILYSVTTKVYLFFTGIYGAGLQAFWPEFAEMSAAKNWGQLRRRLNACLWLGFGLTALWTVFNLCTINLVAHRLVPTLGVSVPLFFVVLLGCYQMIRVWSDTHAMILQSMSHLKPLWAWVPLQAGLSVGLQLWLVPKLGIYGVVLGLIGSFAFTVVWALPFHISRYIAGREVPLV